MGVASHVNLALRKSILAQAVTAAGLDCRRPIPVPNLRCFTKRGLMKVANGHYNTTVALKQGVDDGGYERVWPVLGDDDAKWTSAGSVRRVAGAARPVQRA